MIKGTPALGRIGRYELISRLGAGGMGEVFLARASGAAGFTKPVVIKRILPQLAGDERFIRRILDEGNLVVQLQHSGIGQVLDLGESQGVPYLVMEHIDGKDLRELIRRAREADTTLPIHVSALLLVRVLEALDYAHTALDEEGRPLGIIHRDISPANVMVSRAGEVKLLDFGIAKAVDRQGLSLPGAVQGKFAYMSPEQAAGQDLDARSDQFSVGVMAWELFVGRRPFDGNSDMATLEQIRTLEVGSLGDAWEEAPFDLVMVIDRLLARDRDERYGRAGDAARALREWLISDGSLGDMSEIRQWMESTLQTGDGAPSVTMDDALILGLEPPGDGAERPATATATVMTPGGVTVPTPAHGWQMDEPATSITTPPSLGPTTIGPRRRRRSLIALLVTLNLLLLGAVGFMVWQQRSSPPPGDTPAALKAGAESEGPAAETAEPASEEAPPPQTPQSAGPSAARVEPETTAGPRDVQPSAEPTPEKAVEVPESASSSVAAPTGKVRFRFFPASAQVRVDGSTVKPQRAGSNVVELKLSAGKHSVTLVGADGRRRKTTFQVRAGQLTNLATLSLEEGSQP